MKNNHFLYLILIIILGLLLRLWNIDKPEGMWNDEYLTWSIANLKFPQDFFKGVANNCHAPLHYFYLKGWMALFKDSDISLRFSSLVPGVISIYTMYLCAKEYLVKKHGELCALAAAFLTAVSAFLIYFSQEVRIYALTFLIASMVLYYSLKVFNNPSNKNCWFLTLFSLLLIFEHTIGFVFVAFNICALIAFMQRKKKENSFANNIIAIIILSLPLVPFLYGLFAHPKYFSQWWAPFSWSKLLFYFTDLFSPVLKNISNAPPSFLSQIFDNASVHIGFIIFALVPSFICLGLAIKAFQNGRRVNFYLLTVFCTTFLTVVIAALFGKLIFLTKYLIELYPILILLVAVGWSTMQLKPLKICLATIFAVITLFYIVVSYTSPVRLVREEGQRLPIKVLADLGVKKNDRVLYLYYPPSRFEKYVKEDNLFFYANSIDKYNFPYIVYPLRSDTYEAFKDGKRLYRDVFLLKYNKKLSDFLYDNYYSKMKKGDKMYIVELKTVSFFNDERLENIVLDAKTYKRIPFLYLVTSYAKNYSIRISTKELDYKGHYDSGSWRVHLFEKV